MSSTRRKVFISAVSREFGQARVDVANDLRKLGYDATNQEVFRQEAGSDTTLAMLRGYLVAADTVVGIVGHRSGWFPGAVEAGAHAAVLDDLRARLALPAELTRFSATQWELLWALHLGYDTTPGKRLALYEAMDGSEAEAPPGDGEDGEAQRRFRAWLFEIAGRNRQLFANRDQLLRKVAIDFGAAQGVGPVYVHERFQTIGSLFKGREDDMRRLAEALAKGATAIRARTPTIHGLGGIGKTRLAIEFGLANAARYNALIFLSGETVGTLRRDLVTLCGALRLEAATTGRPEEEQLSAALDWLGRHPGWFLVVDNLDTRETFAEAERLIGWLSGGHVVFTTRLANFSAHFEALDLGVLSVEAAAAFVLERTDGRRQRAADDEAQAAALATDLGQLALALEQACAQIRKNGWSLARYRQEWADNAEAVQGFWDATVTAYPRSLAQTWATSFAQLDASGVAMLRRLAFLAPEPVPAALMDVPIPVAEPEPRQAVMALRDLSLVFFDGETGGFHLHRVVQDVTRRAMSELAREVAATEAIVWLMTAADPARFIGARPDRRNLLRDLAVHAGALQASSSASVASRSLAWLFVEIGDAYRELGLLATARTAYEAGLGIVEALAAADPSDAGLKGDLSVSHIKIGDIAAREGRLAEARAAYEAALGIREALAAADPADAELKRDLSVSHIKIGDIAARKGKLAEARAAYEAGLKIVEALAAGDPADAGPKRDLSVSHNRIGDIAAREGKLAEARAAYEAGLGIAEALAAADPADARLKHDLWVSHSKIGDIAAREGKLAEARAAYEAGLGIVEALAAADPADAGLKRDLSMSHNGIGDIAAREGKLAEARAAYEAGLGIRKALAAADPTDAGLKRDLSVSHDRIGDIAAREGQLAEARAAYEAGLEIAEALAAADPTDAGLKRDLSVSHDRIGDIAARGGKVADARAAYEAGLGIIEALAAADPADAGLKRDLIVSHVKLAETGIDPGSHFGAALAIARALAAEGKLDPQDAWLLGVLQAKSAAARVPRFVRWLAAPIRLVIGTIVLSYRVVRYLVRVLFRR